MILYLFGSDTYRLRKKLREIILAYEKKQGRSSIGRFDLEQDEGALEKLKEFVETRSLFATKKLAVAEVSKADAELKKFLKPLVKDEETTLILVSEEKLGKGFEFLLKEPSKKEEFEELNESQRQAFIQKEAAQRGIKLTAEQTAALVAEENTWSAINQIEILANGGKLEETEANPEFFPLVQAVLSNRINLSRRLAAIDILLRKYDATAAFNVLAALAPAELKPTFADYDIMKKSGKLDYDDALLHFVLSA